MCVHAGAAARGALLPENQAPSLVTIRSLPARQLNTDPRLNASPKWGGKVKDSSGLTRSKHAINGATRIFQLFNFFYYK